MGLDATVRCNCFQKGLTVEPPFPREWLHIDEEGYLALKKAHETFDRLSAFEDWERQSCDHKEMNFCDQHIFNWGGYRQFQEALQDAGIEFFSHLEKELPELNGGLTASAASACCLRELAVFRDKMIIGETTVLVNSATGDVIQERIAAYDGVFMRAGSVGLDFGLTESEFFIRDSETNQWFFSAIRFQQRVLNDESSGSFRERVLYTDMDSKMIFETSVAILGQGRRDRPLEMHVEKRASTADDFDYIVSALEKVFRASVDTGNPVRWC